jgi:hypothetical protein
VMRDPQARQRCRSALRTQQVPVLVVHRTNPSVTDLEPLSALELPYIVPLEEIEPNAVTVCTTLNLERTDSHRLEPRFAFWAVECIIALLHGNRRIEGLEDQLFRAARVHVFTIRDRRLERCAGEASLTATG